MKLSSPWWATAALTTVLAATLFTAAPAQAAAAGPGVAATGGSVTGHVLSDTGAGVAGVSVTVGRVFTGSPVGTATTDAAGAYEVDNLPADRYIVSFRYASGYTVWWPNTTTPFFATPVTVADGAATVVDTTAPAFGSFTVTVKDAVTGSPLAGACVRQVDGPFEFAMTCTGTDGKAAVSGILVGTYEAVVTGPGTDYLAGFASLVVAENTTVTKTVKLKKAAAIHVSFVDAATGDPVMSGCVGVVMATAHNVAGPGPCGSSGSVDVTGLEPSTIRLFATSLDGTHGAQWVGAAGGTGDPDAAEKITLTNGEHLDVTVRFDGAGSIVGTITSAATGQGVPMVCPTAIGPSSGSSSVFNSDCTLPFGDMSAYRITGLGPYAWKVAVPTYTGTYAWTWSGGAANRAKATAVQVVAGTTVTQNIVLPATGTISGTLVPPAGGNPAQATVQVVDAATGDFAGAYARVNADGTFTVTGLNTQRVWIYYNYGSTTYKYPTKVSTNAGLGVTGVVLTVPSA